MNATKLTVPNESIVSYVSSPSVFDSNKSSYSFEHSAYFSNPTSLVNKWDDFNSIIISLDYSHVIGISETYFKSDSIKLVNNYKLYSRERPDSNFGVALYISNDVESVDFS